MTTPLFPIQPHNPQICTTSPTTTSKQTTTVFPHPQTKSRTSSQRATKAHVTQQQQFLFMAPSIPLTFQDRAVTRHQINFPRRLSWDPEAREPPWALTKSCYTLLTDSESLTLFTPLRPQDTPCFRCINATLLWPRKLGALALCGEH